jgi:hypothetical protein
MQSIFRMHVLTDHVRLFLKRELSDSGVVVNREVEIGRVFLEPPIGTSTDIRVDAVRRLPDGSYDSITAVIESKGCWKFCTVYGTKGPALCRLHDQAGSITRDLPSGVVRQIEMGPQRPQKTRCAECVAPGNQFEVGGPST